METTGIAWDHWEDIQDAHDRLGARYAALIAQTARSRAVALAVDRLRQADAGGNYRVWFGEPFALVAGLHPGDLDDPAPGVQSDP